MCVELYLPSSSIDRPTSPSLHSPRGGEKKIGSRDPIEREFDPPSIFFFFFRGKEILEFLLSTMFQRWMGKFAGAVKVIEHIYMVN